MIDRGLGDERTLTHAVVAEAWAAGRLRYAAAALEALIARHPHDILSIRLLHDTYYSLGDSRNLRDACARVLQAWEPSQTGYARLAGMAAFGFEECGQYDRAEDLAMQALGIDPSDTWAAHAAAHVYDSTSRLNEGDRLMRELRDHWADAALLSHHMHWHWGLLQLEEGRVKDAMMRYDDHLTRGRSTVFSASDDAAYLWRMELIRRPLLCPPLPTGRARVASPSEPVDKRYLAITAGDAAAATIMGGTSEVPVSRWTEVARRIRPYVGTHITAFNDVHIVMALVAAGDQPALAAHLAGMQEAADAAIAGVSSVSVGQEGNVDLASLPFKLPPVIRNNASTHAFSRPAVPLPAASSVSSATDDSGLRPMERQLLSCKDSAYGTALAGLDMAHGCVAFWRGDMERACELLLRSRPHWAAIGGSHAQRDVFEQTLIHAAAEAGRWEVARALLCERVGLRFASPQSWYMLGSALIHAGDPVKGADARNRAYVIGLGQTGPEY